ncbi:MAG: hypothetical protein KBT76_14645 [Sulfitobacter litoralis]|nr:hypothetical protein [Sulfitobacter litoralis]
MTDTIQDRLRGVTAFFRFETGDRVAASASLSEEAAAHIDAQDAKIKALVEALGHYACNCGDMCEQLNGTCGDTARAAIAAAKETTA